MSVISRTLGAKLCLSEGGGSLENGVPSLKGTGDPVLYWTEDCSLESLKIF